MNTTSIALISIHPRFSAAILAGRKTIEVRRSPTKLGVGDTLWIYTTSPSKRIDARARVKRTFRISPSELWQKHKNRLALSKAELMKYAEGCVELTAIVIGDVVALAKALPLSELRKLSEGFQPPQFMVYIDQEHPLRRVLGRI